MLYSVLADLVLVTHFLYILFAIFGALLVIKYRWLAWLQIPAFIWAATVNTSHTICPLTHLENYLRIRAGQGAYQGDFIQHYLMPIIYPGPMTQEFIIGSAITILIGNAAIYAGIYYKAHKLKSQQDDSLAR